VNREHEQIVHSQSCACPPEERTLFSPLQGINTSFSSKQAFPVNAKSHQVYVMSDKMLLFSCFNLKILSLDIRRKVFETMTAMGCY